MEPWNPWRALRACTGVTLWFAPLHGARGLWLRDGPRDVIVLDTGLGRRERRCVLAHELVHHERGIGLGAASAATMVREEEAVRREVARRLVPLASLDAFVRAASEIGPVSADEVGCEFDVEVAVAVKALELLRQVRFGAS